LLSFFFFNHTPTTYTYTLSLHDALPISCSHGGVGGDRLSMAVEKGAKTAVVWLLFTLPLSLLEGVFSQNGPQRSRARRCCAAKRSEEHTSEFQSRGHLVCRLLLEKKKKK